MDVPNSWFQVVLKSRTLKLGTSINFQGKNWFSIYSAIKSIQTIFKQLWGDFWKNPENGFLTLKIVKMTFSEHQNLILNLYFMFLYQPLKLRIHFKSDFCCQKKCPKSFLIALKQLPKRPKSNFVSPKKWSKWPSQRAKIWPKFQFLSSSINPSNWKYNQNWVFLGQNLPQNISENLQNNF